MTTTVTVTTDQPAVAAAPTPAQAAIAAAEPKGSEPQLQPGEVQPEIITGATPAPNAFASEDAELARLVAEQAAIDAKKAAESPPIAAPTPAATPAPAAAAPVKPAPNPMESAIIGLRKKNSELAAQNLILEGERRALSSIVTAPAVAVTPPIEEAPADPDLDAIEAEYADIAKKVDDGDISNVEAEKLRREVRARERTITEQRVMEAAATPVNDLGLQEHVETLVQDFPVLNKLSAAQLSEFERKVYAKAVLEDNPIPVSAIGTKRLRYEMAVMAEQKHDPAAAAARKAKTGTGPAPAGQPAPATTPTAAQREAKLTAAGQMPPDIGAVGTGAVGGEMSVAQGEVIFNSLKGEDEQIRWLQAHPQFVDKVMAGSMRPSR